MLAVRVVAALVEGDGVLDADKLTFADAEPDAEKVAVLEDVPDALGLLVEVTVPDQKQTQDYWESLFLLSILLGLHSYSGFE
jgi:hypothetical protein